MGLISPVRSSRPEKPVTAGRDRKSTRLNSSHLGISYAVFCLEKKGQGVGNMDTLKTPLGRVYVALAQERAPVLQAQARFVFFLKVPPPAHFSLFPPAALLLV